ncbi:uncharacterized protein DUF4241 [Luteococcus japonicus]|uniref:Uncharacterized protein DUF4241 n=1 Tax=Luteococcus japonicus TaxID=33984 RepID=A0A3N1ZW76_9ACTN|nr:DUF4241 domain-containing protein [Luteococcus japonicus]ROR55109.1 uncharacterized protein DUF4241 [Luteococcus japonicus]
MTTLPSNQPTWALGEGPARLLGDDGPARLRIELMGTLELRDGWLACVDPYTLASQVELEVPAGEHEVYVTVADVSEEQDGSHCRNSALSLLLAPLEEVRTSTASLDALLDEDGDVQAVGVDAGVAAMMDRSTFRSLHEMGDQLEQVNDRWLELAESRHATVDGFVDDVNAAGRVVAVDAGWGDGGYAVVRAFDADGRLLAVHLDFEVIDGPRPKELLEDGDDVDDEFDDEDQTQPTTADKPKTPMSAPIRAFGAVLLITLFTIPGLVLWSHLHGRSPGALAWAALLPPIALSVVLAMGRRRRGDDGQEDDDAASTMFWFAGIFLLGGILLLKVSWPVPVLLHLLAGGAAGMVVSFLLGSRDGTRTNVPLWAHGPLALAGSSLLHLAAAGRLSWSPQLGAWAAILLGQALLPAWLALKPLTVFPEFREELGEHWGTVDGVHPHDALVWHVEEGRREPMGMCSLVLALVGALVVVPLSMSWPWIAWGFLAVVLVVTVRDRLRLGTAERALGERRAAVRQQLDRLYPNLRAQSLATAVAQVLLVVGACLCPVAPLATLGLYALAAAQWVAIFLRGGRRV